MQQKNHPLRILIVLALTITIALQQVLPIMAQSTMDRPTHQLFLPLVAVNASGDTRSSGLANDKQATSLRYIVGQKYSYQWNAVTTAQGNAVDNTTLQKAVNSAEQMQANATVELVPVEVNAQGSTLVEMTVLKPAIGYQTEKGNFVYTQDDELIKALATPIYFEQASNGQITSISYAARESADAVNLKRGIISALQTQLQSTGDVGESDVSGLYTANYQQQQSKSGLQITKKRNQDAYSAFADATILDRSFQLDSQSTSTFDAQIGIIRSTTFRDYIVSSNDTTPTAEYGITPWSETTVTGSLQLQAIGKGWPQPVGEGYIRSSLVATVSPELASEAGASEIVLADTLAAIEQTPTELVNFTQLVQALKQPDALRELSANLDRLQANPQAMGVVIGALTTEGSEAAQELLVTQIVLNPAQPSTIQESALLSLMFLKTPSQLVIDTLTKLSNDRAYPLYEQAILTLGAIAHTVISTAPDSASMIVYQLQQQLADAQDEDAVLLTLRALGNAGHPETVETIVPYIDAASPWVQVTAIDALRKVPGDKVDTLLIELGQQETNAVARELAQALYAQRNTDGITAAAVNGVWEWTKTKWIGNGDIKGELTFKLKATDTPDINLSATGEALAHAWSWSYSILKGQLLSEVITQNGEIKRHSLAELKVLNNSIAKEEHYLVCGEEKSGSVLSSPLTQQFFSLSKNFYPWGIQVTLSLKASGSLDLKYKYKFTACNAPIQAGAEGSLTPVAKLTAQGDAMVSIYIARGGARLTADILKTSLPASLSAQINNGAFQACANLKLELEPISGKLRLWYQLRKLTGGWKPEQGWDVWSFSSPTQSTTLLSECLP